MLLVVSSWVRMIKVSSIFCKNGFVFELIILPFESVKFYLTMAIVLCIMAHVGLGNSYVDYPHYTFL
jgi:hypothetical protein